MVFYTLFSHTLAVMSEVPDLAEHIHCFTKRFERAEDGGGQHFIRLAIFQSRRNHVMFCCPELGFHASSPQGMPAWITYRRVFGKLALGMGRPHYVLHASCVADPDGRAILVSGESDSGKTSTLLALLQRGYRYAGDDYAIIGLDDGRLRALPVGVTVTDATFAMFPSIGPLRSDTCKFHCQEEWQWTINPSDLYETVSPFAELDIRGVFFLHPAFGSVSRIESCPSEEALWRLQSGEMELPTLNGPKQWRPVNPRLLEKRIAFARDLVQKAAFFNVTNGDVQQTADLIVEKMS